MQNVQLSMREAVKVYVEIGSQRILGFSPAFANLLQSSGFRYTEKLLLHAWEVEQWAKRYRQQQERDAEESSYRQIKRESGFRKELRSSIEERNKHVNQYNRDLNNVLLRLMEERYDAMMKAKAKPDVHMMTEESETKPRDIMVEEFALASPSFREKPDPRVTGAAVRGDLAKIHREKIN